jgi:ribosomal protein eS8
VFWRRQSACIPISILFYSVFSGHVINGVALYFVFLCILNFYMHFSKLDPHGSMYIEILFKKLNNGFVSGDFGTYRYELGRQPANTKLSSNKTVRRVRVRGGNVKWRALRLDTGNYSWGSEAVTRKTRILDVVYNASNNELVRTQTLVKSAIVQVDAAPFKQWYLQHYGVDIGRKKKAAATKKEGEV